MSDEKLKACAACGCLYPLNGNGHMCPTPTAEKADVVEAVALAMANYDAAQVDAPLLSSVEDFRQDVDRQEYMARARAAIAVLQSRPAEPAPTSGGFLSFWYKNYRGEISERTVRPIRIYHGATEWHPAPQWLLEAFDLEKDAVRAFAMCDMQAPPAEPAGEELVAEKPFGWFYEGPAGQNQFYRQEMSIPKRWTETPLYSRPAPSNPDTVAFVQEWMMSGDHEADQWHRDFAAAIDARHTPSNPDGLVDWRGHCEWLLDLDEIHVGEGETDVLERIALIRADLSSPALNGEKGE